MSTATPSSSSHPSAAVKPALPLPTAAQQRVLDRIAVQRARLSARRLAQAQALAASNQAAGGANESLTLRVAGFAREHPLAVAAMAGVAAVAGPRKLIRWAGVLLPMLLRLRR